MGRVTQGRLSAAADLDRFPGRRIVVDSVSGNDAPVGDGSNSYPYKTMAQATTDLRSAKGDVVLLDTGGTIHREVNQIRISNLLKIGIFGRGSAFFTLWDAPTGPLGGAGFAAPTVLTRISATVLEYTITSHGLTTSDYVGWFGPTTADNNIVRLAKVTSVPTANTFQVTYGLANLNVAEAPFVGGDLGLIFIPSLVMLDPQDPVISNLGFGNSAITVRWSGIGFAVESVGGLGARMINCAVTHGTVWSNGIAFFAIDNLQAIMQNQGNPTDVFAATPSMALHGGETVVLNDSFFLRTGIFPGGQDDAEGHIYLNEIQTTGNHMSGNRFSIQGPAALGAVEGDIIQANAGVTQADVDDFLVASRNLFVGHDVSTPFSLSDELVIRDTSPTSDPSVQELSSQPDINWVRPARLAIAVPNSMGEIVGIQAYQGTAGLAVHYDASASNTNTIPGIDGTATNPVSSEAAVRSLLGALPTGTGLQKVSVRGALVLAGGGADYAGVFFQGPTPSGGSVDYGNQDCNGATFNLLALIGTLPVGSTISAENCLIGVAAGTTQMQGLYIENGYNGILQPIGKCTLQGAGSDSIAGTVFDFSAAAGAVEVKASGVAGVWIFRNLAVPTTIVGFQSDGSRFTIEATVAAGGLFDFAGVGELANNGTPTALIDRLVKGSEIAATLVDTADMQPKLGTPAADISADIAAIKVETAAIDGRLPAVPSDFDETADPVELLDSGGGAGSSAAELVVDIEAFLATVHGTGQWDGTDSDWTAAERANIRDALGVDGTKTTATGGQMQKKLLTVAKFLGLR